MTTINMSNQDDNKLTNNFSTDFDFSAPYSFAIWDL